MDAQVLGYQFGNGQDASSKEDRVRKATCSCKGSTQCSNCKALGGYGYTGGGPSMGYPGVSESGTELTMAQPMAGDVGSGSI